MMGWHLCKQPLPASLMTGLGAAPPGERIYSASHDAWFALQDGQPVRWGLGSAQDFDDAANDLSSLVLAIEDVGDQALASQQYDAAVAAYKGAATNGLRVAQKIATAGSPAATAPLLAQAAIQAARVAAAPSVGATEPQAGDAGVACNKMGQLYSQAIVDGKAALGARPPAPKPPTPAPAAKAESNYVPAIALGLTVAAGLVGWALWPK